MVDKIRSNPPTSVVMFPDRVQAIEKYRSLYDDITLTGAILQFCHRHALGELAVALVETELLREQLYDPETGGDAMKVQGDRNLVTKKNPARDALEKLRPNVLRLMKEFGMTPGSVGKPGLRTPTSGCSPADDEFSRF